MKFKTTQRDVKSGYEHVIQIPYCGFQNALEYFAPVAYTTRREGWGSDVYEFGNIAISTGYAPFGDIKVSYEVLKKYADEALSISRSNKPWNEKKSDITLLVKNFLDEVV